MHKTETKDAKVQINYQLIRNVTSPEEKQNGVATYVLNMPAFELRLLDTDDNLRDYIPGSNFEHIKNTKRNAVHKAIARTIDQDPDRFINRNGGVTITCGALEIDDKAQVVRLVGGSIINGAQTRGEILRYRHSLLEESDGEPESPFNVRAEIIVDPDHSSVVETAIARNTASPVKSISQAGGRGQLDELGEVVNGAIGREIKKSETDDNSLVDTFHVLQVSRLLMPPEVSKNESMSEILKPYKQRAQCLEEFTKWFENKSIDEDDAARYEFVLQIAPIAISEFKHWQEGAMWDNKNIRAEVGSKNKRSFRRNKKTRGIDWVAPGIIFPVLSAMREFIVKRNGRWTLLKPEIFEEDELVTAALEQWRGHDNNPMWMGRSASAYSALRHVTRTYKRAAERMI